MLNWYLEHLQPSQILSPDEDEVDAYNAVADWAVNKHVPAYTNAAIDEFLDVADPWLVASAYRNGATLVTNEIAAPDGKKKVKIPDAAAVLQCTLHQHARVSSRVASQSVGALVGGKPKHPHPPPFHVKHRAAITRSNTRPI